MLFDGSSGFLRVRWPKSGLDVDAASARWCKKSRELRVTVPYRPHRKSKAAEAKKKRGSRKYEVTQSSGPPHVLLHLHCVV